VAERIDQLVVDGFDSYGTHCGHASDSGWLSDYSASTGESHDVVDKTARQSSGGIPARPPVLDRVTLGPAPYNNM
jgi:hypothetical protein